MDNIFEKNSLILILLKIFDIYLCRYFASNKEIVITHLWHAIEPQAICHLIGKGNVAEQHISRKSCNCNSFYPTALKGCWGIVFTHGVRMGGRVGGRREKSLSGLYLRNRKV